MQRADRIGPALLENALERGAAFRLDQRILGVGFRRIDIEVGRHDVVVAGEHDRHARAMELARMPREPREPGELVVEFRTGLRVAVRRVQGCDQHALHGRLDVAALRVGRIARQCGAGQHRLGAARQDRHAVPRFLSAPDRAIAGLLDRRGGEFAIRGLELLQADDVGLRRPQPGEQVARGAC